MAKKSSDFFFIVDIRSSSVGASIISNDKNGIVIIWTDRIYHYFSEENPSDEYSNFIYKGLEKIIKNSIEFINKNKISIPENTIISYGSKWVEEVISKNRKEFDKLKEINKNDIKKGEIEINQEKKLLENVNYCFKVNGYLTKNPISKKAKVFESFNYSTSIDKKFNATILGIIKSYLPKTNIREISHFLTFFKGLNGIFPYLNDYVLIEISGEITSLMIVRERNIESIKSFNFGRNHLVRKISEIGKISIEEALSLFRMYENHSLGTKQTEQLDKMIAKPISEWKMWLEKTLSTETIIPTNWYVIGDRDIEELFTSFINSIEINNLKRHNTIPIHQKTLNNVYSYAKNIHPEPTMALGICGIIYYDL